MNRQLGTADAETVDIVAAKYRQTIIPWIHKLTKLRSDSRPSWRSDFKTNVVVQVLSSPRSEQHEILTAAAQQLKQKYTDPDKHARIEFALNGFLKKSPVEAFLTATAYKWLLHLETSRPKYSNWYPDMAVEVAHRVFRLKGKLSTFLRYLDHRSRRKRLKSIDFQYPGMCCI